MLYTSIVTLYLVCFLHCFEPVQCRSTRHPNEYDNRSSLTRRCLRSCFLISRHQTCFEKCLGKNKEGDFTYLNPRIQRINPPHLTPAFKRRKRSTEERGIPCPREPKGNNSLPTLRTPERNQYENSSKWYLNISWNSLPDSPNFTGYGIAYACTDDRKVLEQSFLEMPKNETFKIFNESDSCWSCDMDFYFIVLGLPCLRQEEFTYEDLPWRRDSQETCNGTETANVTATPNVKKASTSATNLDEFSSAGVSLTVIGIMVALVFVISAAYLYLRKRKRDARDVSIDDADYDAFIIFNHNDQKWVQETLLPILEKESHYKCCVHYRDFAPGEEFVVNMTESVRKSKKVIAVISKTFFSSHWCNFELQQAIYQHIKKGSNGVIVIKIDDVSTEMFPKAIQTKSFIDYSNRVERPFFKTRLLKVLESSSDAYKKDIIPMQIND